MAQAIVDRILERGRVLTLDGPSMRTKHLGLDDPTINAASIQLASASGKSARISGIDAPQFPEPTTQSTQTAQSPHPRLQHPRIFPIHRARGLPKFKSGQRPGERLGERSFSARRPAPGRGDWPSNCSRPTGGLSRSHRRRADRRRGDRGNARRPSTIICVICVICG
ncbi:MAG: hypothetical protein ACT4QD_14475 [Acidobacteriota bacterium]